MSFDDHYLNHKHFVRLGNLILGSWRLSIERNLYTGEQIRDIYDRAAKSWSGMQRFLGFNRLYDNLANHLITGGFLDYLPTNSRVLDAGIGTGDMTKALFTYLPHCEIHGVDVSPKMLDMARRNLQRLDISARLQQASITNLPYPDNTFDLITTIYVLEHLKKPEQAIDELYRVLKPGGRLLVMITPKNFWGMLIELEWRVRMVSQIQLQKWLLQSGFLQIHFLDPGGPFWCKKMCLVCIVEKPC